MPLSTWGASPAWPPVNGTTDTQEWAWLIKAWYAMRQRPWCHSSTIDPRWPRSSVPFYAPSSLGGFVTAITATTLTDEDATEWDGTGPVPWATGEEDPFPAQLGGWKIVIERGPSDYGTFAEGDENDPAFLDPVPVVIADITDFSDAGTTQTITIEDISDYVTSGEIGALSELVGKPYWIIPDYGVWWSERIPEWPNAEEMDFGTATLGTATTLTDLGVTTENGRVPWDSDEWVGKEIIAIGDYGLMVRGGIITGNTADTLTYTGALFELAAPDGGAVELIAGSFGFAYQYGFAVKDPAEDEYGLPRLLGSAGTFDGAQTARITGIPSVGGGNELWLLRRHGGPDEPWHLIADVTGLSTHDDVASFGAGATLSESREYAIIREGKVYRFGRRRHEPHAWYRGAGLGYDDEGDALNLHYSHYPDDTLQPTRFPADAVEWSSPSEVDPETCEIQGHDDGLTALDWDAWSAGDEECSPADKPYSKDLPKSFRFIQQQAEYESSFFIERKTYSGDDAVPSFTLATFFKAAGINHQTVTIASATYSSGTGLTTVTLNPLTLPFTPITVYYAILTYNPTAAPGGEIAYSGSVAVTNAAAPVITITGNATDDVDPVQAGKSVVISLGWSRFVPREFRRAFPQTCFIPDVREDNGEAQDPATVVDWDEYGDNGVGEWVKKSASTHYANQTGGQPVDGPEDFDLFATNNLARFVGDNWNDGVPHGGIDTFVPSDVRLPFYNKFNVSVHAEDNETKITGQTTGVATADGTTTRLTQTGRDWWTNNWYTGGVGHTETGTATAGGTTSLEDDTKDTTAEAGAFWIDRRFDGFGGPYVDFIIEVEIDAVWHKRLIITSSADDTGAAVEWGEALPESADEKNYRIREPKYEINRWQGRRLTLTYPDGTTAETFVTHSDDDTLWFEEVGSPVVTGTRFTIHEPRPGGVWRYADSPPAEETGLDWFRVAGPKYWVQPLPPDEVRTGVPTPADFHPNARENLPTIVKRYGRDMKGDYRTRTFYQQVHDAINVLRMTKMDPDWRSRADLEVEEKNILDANADVGSGTGSAVQQMKNTVEDAWGDPLHGSGAFTESESSGTRPRAAAGTEFTEPDAGSLADASKSRAFAYAVITNVPIIIASTAKLLTKAQKSGGGPDDTSFTPDGSVNYFATFGDPVQNGKWQEWTGAGFGGSLKTAERVSDRIGSDAEPSGWPTPDPPEPAVDWDGDTEPDTASSTMGYAVIDELVTLDWAVTYV